MGDIPKVATACQWACEHGCAPGVEVGLARQRHVERLEPFGRAKQQSSSVASGTRDERDLAAQQVRSRALELI
jgi:hypothetical protein